MMSSKRSQQREDLKRGGGPSPNKIELKKTFNLPENFHERVLHNERDIERLKEKTPHKLLQSLLQLYSDAIEYYAYMDENDMSMDLTVRMQSLLVRPYILDALTRYHDES
jgi:hypothetical protein